MIDHGYDVWRRTPSEKECVGILDAASREWSTPDCVHQSHQWDQLPASTPETSCLVRLITSTYLCVSSDAKSFWPPWSLVAALFVLLVFSGNVFAARGKPSASQAEPTPTRDSSVVLETHQLYSKD